MNLRSTLAFVFLLVSSSCTQACCTQARDVGGSRSQSPLLPELSEEELRVEVNAIKQIFSSEYRKAEDTDQDLARSYTLALSRRLLKTAEETPIESNGYYAILSEAVRLAIVADNAKTAFEGIHRLQKTHEVDASEMELELLDQIAKKETRISDVRNARGFLLPAIQKAADSQQLDTAVSITNAGKTIAERLLDQSMKDNLAKVDQMLQLLQRQQSEFAASLEAIGQNAEDTNANLKVAKFLGLRKSDWENAESYAAKSNMEDIRSLFVREAAILTETSEILRLANDWWMFAETHSGAEKLQAKELAASKYAAILNDLKGIEQKQAETRLADVVGEQIVKVRIPSQTSLNAPEINAPEISYISVAREMDGLLQAFSFDNETLQKATERDSVGRSVVSDISGNGVPGNIFGTVNSGDDTKGVIGQCLKFGGSGQVVFADLHLPMGRDARSISLWIKAGPQKNNGGTVFKYGGNAGNGIVLFIFTNDSPEPYRGKVTLSQEGDLSPQFNLTTTTDITDSKWHHIVLTIDDDNASLFVDGKKQSEKVLVKNTGLVGTAIIGNLAPGDSVHGLNGAIDEFLFFSRALTEKEVSLLFSSASQGK